MNRIKTFDATGVAPDGRLFAGDVNAIMDAAAALTDDTQTIKLNALSIHDDSLQLLKYGTAEARVTGSLRADGILRGLTGIIAGAYTTSARNSISAPPYGMQILNTTTNQYEWNKGTSGSPVWAAMGFIPSNGTSIVNADVGASAGIVYSKLTLTGGIVDGDVSASAGLSPSKLSGYPNNARMVMLGDGSWAIPIIAENAQTANYILVLADSGKLVAMNVGSANTLTVPPNSSVAFPIGSVITFAQYGAGLTTLTAGAGVTLRSYNGNLKMAGRYSVGTAIKRGTDEWWVAGNLVP